MNRDNQNIRATKLKNLVVLFVSFLSLANLKAQQPVVKYISSFENTHHPQVAYWFITDKMMAGEKYREKIDSLAKYSKYTLIFLTQRDNCDFYDIKTMHPFFKKLVDYAHLRGLKIALQIWKDDHGTKIENTDRLMQEGELKLDEAGRATYRVKAKGARDTAVLLKSELFRIYAFRKTADGFYDATTLKDITTSASATNTRDEVNVSINAGPGMQGYTAYILTQHYYQSCNNFSTQAKDILLNAFKAYADIPFDGIGLDEYKGFKIARQKILETTNDLFRERVYSLGMAAKMKATTGADLNRVLFDMRYAPQGKPEIRIKAINGYMSLLRTATLDVEAAMYDLGKKMYGKNAFIGLHNTFHNNLDKDEVWQTGVSWWSIKRDYGHTDENTPTPIQMGVGMSYAKNAMYNMYYDHSLEKIYTKALLDLRYGVRTHYHAANDVNGWGVSIDAPEALPRINQVENAARLLNRFDPLFPRIKLLVVYGMEAQYNWYPNGARRGMYDVTEKLDMDKKSIQLWNAGYLNASVPTDLIEDGRLQLNAAGKPVLNGYVFDAVIFLNPQYARSATTKFFTDYVNKGGSLLIEGETTTDYNGNDMRDAWKKISAKAVATSFTIDNVAKLKVAKNELTDGVTNTDGSYTFTNAASLDEGVSASFSFKYNNDQYTGTYKGIAVIKLTAGGDLQKLAATGFSSLEKNGRALVKLNKAADIFVTMQNGKTNAVIADETHQTKMIIPSK